MQHAKYFLGFYDEDWAPMFIGMLSRKLEELLIENEHFPEYLSKRSADILREVSIISNRVVNLKKYISDPAKARQEILLQSYMRLAQHRYAHLPKR